jgi:3'-phosphoadenosine 5'-phosphosulfate sulfotransferase (PAPS reductase)/FAD synthetase
MNKKVRHVLGISGGKDSAALAIYLNDNYPSLEVEYYFCDTGKELDETYQLIDALRNRLGKEIAILEAANTSHVNSFDHYLDMFRGYLPSSNARWCTKKLKLEPFEKFVGDDPVISYVGIRDDEDREGYISRKPNIQSIFPFRKNIWSEDVINLVLKNNNIEKIGAVYKDFFEGEKLNRVLETIYTPISEKYNQKEKLRALHNLGIADFNKAVFNLLKNTNYPIANENDFPLLKKEEGLIREDIFAILRSTVGVPQYYNQVEFEVNGKKGTYARSRSGCFFCFFQQKIEWIWLYEQHPDLFLKAMEYEKDGYAWIENETLAELIKPERMERIKEDHIKKQEKSTNKNNSKYLIDILEDAESEGCAACFI